MQNTTYIFNYGKTKTDQFESNVKDAEERLQKAVELNPDDYSIYASIIRIYSPGAFFAKYRRRSDAGGGALASRRRGGRWRGQRPE